MAGVRRSGSETRDSNQGGDRSPGVQGVDRDVAVRMGQILGIFERQS